MAYPRQARREVITTEVGTPVIVRLRWTDGKQIMSPSGSYQTMFTTLDDRVLFVPPAVGQRIAALGLKPGEKLGIWKQQSGGRNKAAVFDLFTGAEVGEIEKALDKDATPLMHTMARSIDRQHQPGSTSVTVPIKSDPVHRIPREVAERMAQPRRPSSVGWIPPDAEERIMERPLPQQIAPRPQETKSAGFGDVIDSMLKSDGAAPVEVSKRPPQVTTGWPSFLLQETEKLTDVYAAALKHANESHGGLVKAEDVRSLMVTAFINLSKSSSFHD